MIKNWMMKLAGRTPPGDIDCHEVGELLQQYLDGYTDADRSARIGVHLEACRRCGMDAAAYEQIKRTLATQRQDLPAASLERLREFGERLADGDHSPTT